jgi:pyruvate dehydrogenase E2 component (dihydrolipoamide acetyltransferase)
MGNTKNDSASDLEFTEIDAPLIRKIIAERMLESKLTIPHFYIFDEVDMKKSVVLRRELNADEKYKISFNDFIVKAGAHALQEHPDCNVSYIDGRIRQYQNININIAVAIDGGLLVPTLKNCDHKSLREISVEARSLIEKARNKKLRPREQLGGSFTISNLGVYGLEGSFSIINPPQALILTVGAIREVPVVEDGKVVVGVRMKITLSCDHRAVDGAMGAGFLLTVKNILEQPREYIL